MPRLKAAGDNGIFYLGVARAGKGFIAEAVIWAKIGLDPVSFSSYSVGDGPWPGRAVGSRHLESQLFQTGRPLPGRAVKSDGLCHIWIWDNRANFN